MNDFNGLGIVLEEKDSNGEPSSYLENNTETLDSPRTMHRISATENEILLPPLPHGEIDLNRTPSLTNSNTDDVNTVESYNSGDFEDSRRGSDFSDFFNKQSDFSNYELDSPSLKIDSKFHLFPSLTKANQQAMESNSSSNGVSSSSNNNNNNNNNTSPLKRLKSLKKGIRKFSLNSLNSSRSNSSGMLNKPEMAPLPVDSRSSESSNRSSLSNMDTFSVHSNQAPGSISKLKRSRTLSYPIANTPLTPPISSPVVTVSENLSAAKKSLYTTEQSYFESLNLKSSISTSASSDNDSAVESDQFKYTDTNSLVSYFKFLKQQKKSVIDAYELTKTKLADSGWCSDHDLNNIQLQQDTSLCQIDTKLSQIREELRKENNIDCNESPDSKSSTSHEKEDPILSLKLLESRYLSMAEAQKNS